VITLGSERIFLTPHPFPLATLMDIDHKLVELGLTLPAAPKPVGAYVPCVRTGNLVIVSGQLPFAAGNLLATGKVPSVVDLTQATECARQCVLNGLAILRAELGGDWSRLVRVVRIGAFIQSDDGFGDQPQVANGASDLLVQLLGDAGKHARAAVGTNALPLNAPVEIEFTFEVR
jgi:enamine deaminase RidA (YjgF/YER057c/UK114 family)